MLEKYHKQKIDKNIVNQYKALNRKFDLGYKLDSDYDFIKLSVFQTALNQKKIFETTYEKTRNTYFDMWDRLSFYERNEILLQALEPKVKDMKFFIFEDTKIYMPFFDRLLNSLFATETAILELPQFLKLYNNFKEKLIPLEFYKLESLRSGFSSLELIAQNDESIILYYPIKKIFYKINNQAFERYPIDIKSMPTQNQIQLLSNQLLISIEDFYDTLIENTLIRKRCIKKILKKRKKETKNGNQ